MSAARKSASPASDSTLIEDRLAPNARPTPGDPPPHQPSGGASAHGPTAPASAAAAVVSLNEPSATPQRSESGWHDFDDYLPASSIPVASAPYRPAPYKRTTSGTQGRVANPLPLRPPIAPSPLVEHLARQAAMDASDVDERDVSVVGNDSTETVTPARKDASLTPGAIARAALRQSYAVDKIVVDLGSEGSGDDGPRGTREVRETIHAQITRTAYLVPLPRYFKKVVSRYALITGVVGQFEEALEHLNEVAETTYARLSVPDKRRLLGPGWHEPLVMLANQDFARFGEGQCAFKHITAWIRHALGFVESLLELPDAHDYELPPPPLDLELKGHFNSFAEATMQGMLRNPDRPDSGGSSPTPSQLGDTTDTLRPAWKVKDTVAAAKILMSPDINSFYGAPFKRDARCQTSVRNPLDFSHVDPMAGLLSPAPKRIAADPPGTVSMSDALARTRARPAQLPARAAASFATQDATFLTPAKPHPASQPPSRRSPARERESPGRSRHQGAGDPDDDGDDEGDDGDPDPRGNRGFRPSNDQGRAGGRGDPPPGDTADGGGGDDPGGDAFTAPNPNQQRRAGLVIDMRIKLDSLPAWSGDDDSALSYFSQLSEWVRADKSGELFYQIPVAAPLRWTGSIRTWWGNLSPGLRNSLSAGFHVFVPGIREHFLSQRWAEARRAEFVAMEFRQRGYDRETPFDYINRQLFLARVLFDMTQEELVSEVLANTPQQWAYVIGEHNLKTTDELMKRFKQLGPSLTSAYLAGEAPDAASTKAKLEEMVDARLDAWMRKQGTQSATRLPVSNNPFRAPPPAKPYAASARLAELEPSALHTEPLPVELDSSPATIPEMAGAHGALFNTAFAFLSSGAKQRPRPVGGYHFKESDVVSKVPPPFPCKVCGSGAHWDRECGHYQSYLLWRQKNAMISTVRTEDEERMYNAVYSVVANETAFSSCALEPEAFQDLNYLLRRQPSVEEVEDEESADERKRPVLKGPGILATAAEADEEAKVEECPVVPAPTVERAVPVHVLDEQGLPELLQVEDSDDEDEEFELQESLQRAIFAQAMSAASNISAEAGAPPHDRPLRDPNLPATECVLRMPKKREHQPGLSSKGISVLSCRGRVGSLEERMVTLRLDSCTDLCLVHKKFLDAMKNPPRIRRGLKVQIAQLTNNAPEIEGYVNLPMFIRGEDGTMLEFDIEAYVVPDMTVDLLVGEDWHVNYEVDVLRSIEHGTRVRVGDTGYYFQATSLTLDTLRAEKEARIADARALRVVHGHLAHFVRAKSHQRAKAARRRKRLSSLNGELRAFRDTAIPAETTALVDFAGSVEPGRDWFVERNLIRVEKDVFLSVPNALISTSIEPVSDGDPSIARRYAIAVTNPSSSVAASRQPR